MFKDYLDGTDAVVFKTENPSIMWLHYGHYIYYIYVCVYTYIYIHVHMYTHTYILLAFYLFHFVSRNVAINRAY